MAFEMIIFIRPHYDGDADPKRSAPFEERSGSSGFPDARPGSSPIIKQKLEYGVYLVLVY